MFVHWSITIGVLLSVCYSVFDSSIKVRGILFLDISALNKSQKYDLCIKVLSALRGYLNGDEAACVDGALKICQAWSKDHSLDIAVELYNYIDGEERGFTLYQEAEEDVKMIALWNCIIDSAAYICRGAFESQGAKYFPEPIELVDEDIFIHLEESFLQFSGNRDELDKMISDCIN